MKIIFTTVLCFLLTPVFASDVKVTSFQYLGSSRVAELCGEVKGELRPTGVVEIVSDPGMKAPGFYATPVSKNGKFCLVLRTLSGNADVTYNGQTIQSLSVK